MKKILWLLSFAVVLLPATAQTAGTTTGKFSKEVQKQITKAVKSKDYTIAIESVKPELGNKVDLTTAYELVMQDDSVFGYMPYFGANQEKPYAGAEIRFREPVKDYTLVSNDRKTGYTASFSVMGSDGLYNLVITIKPDKSVTMKISPPRYAPVSYWGYLVIEN